MRSIERRCDMREGFKLKLLISNDGDFHVSVLPEEDIFSFDSVEFCSSGTQSPRTQMALHDLYKAMLLDEEERPHKERI